VVATQCWKIISDIIGTTDGLDLSVIGQFWLSNKRHCILNIVTSATFWSIWKFRNEILFQNVGWRTSLQDSWALAKLGDLVSPEKKDLVKQIEKKIEEVPKMTFCLPEAGT
jgi:hypothetical protein